MLSVGTSRASFLASLPHLCAPSSSILFGGLFLCSSPFCILTGVIWVGVSCFPSAYAKEGQGRGWRCHCPRRGGTHSHSASSVGGAQPPRSFGTFSCWHPRLLYPAWEKLAFSQDFLTSAIFLCSWHKRYPFIYARFNLQVRLIQIL